MLKTVIALLSAFLPPLIGLIGIAISRDRQPRAYKQLTVLSEVFAKLPTDSEVRSNVGELIAAITLNTLERERSRKPLNPTNVTLTVLFSAGTGYGSFLLFEWAATAGSPWPWVLLALGLTITVLFIGGSVGTIRNPRNS
jgi:hypothetical protein